MRALIIASGGGHTGHAVALAERLLERGADIGFVIPEGDRWTELKVSELGPIAARTPRFLEPGEGLLPGLLRAPGAVLRALRGVPRGYDVVIATGSNHSIAAAVAAWAKGSDVVVVEATERFLGPSRALRALSPISRLVALQWEEQRGFARKGVVVGPLLGRRRYEPRDGGFVLISAGTYGYRRLFDAAAASGIEDVVVQTGRVDPTPYSSIRGWRAFAFEPDLERLIAEARVVVTHFGRTAVESACKYGKPTVLAPNPEWVWMRKPERMREAEMMANRLGAYFLPPEEVTPEGFRDAVEGALRTRPAGCEDGALRLADIIASWGRST
ncbi:MAG: UDP-N-acetylglucosamine--N-acetylmuramyl-(pentapeptide) pyrophosphoryl-undecaprenol N-acetylglucosamine transferase [Acidilobus sp.]